MSLLRSQGLLPDEGVVVPAVEVLLRSQGLLPVDGAAVPDVAVLLRSHGLPDVPSETAGEAIQSWAVVAPV
ncbi:hypothetical protein GS584_25225 [Rhodococcus hoagii]|nr:hypothetical protein [Prescottella equi]